MYDTENDPWEINNLAGDPKYAEVLKRMRKALDNWRMETYDVGVIPETNYAELAGNMPLYDYVRSQKCPYEKLLIASDLAVLGSAKDIDTFVKYLHDENSAVRYWGATGLLVLKDAAKPAIDELKKAANDPSVAVATLAAEALYLLGDEETADKTYAKYLNMNECGLYGRVFVLNSIDAVNNSSPEIKISVQKLIDDLNVEYEKTHPANQRRQMPSFMPQGYAGDDMKVAKYLVEKWKKM